VVPGATVVSMSTERGSRDTFGNGMQRLFQRFHVGAASLEVAERFLEVVALHVDDNDVGELEGVFGERGDERLFIEDAALDHGVDFGVFGLDGDIPRFKSWIFQKLRVLGRCMPMTNLAGLPDVLSTVSATIAAMTAPTKPTPTTTTISLPSARALSDNF